MKICQEVKVSHGTGQETDKYLDRKKKKGAQKEINIYINLVHDKEDITNL